LEGPAIQGDVRGPNDSPKVQERLIIYFIAAEEVGVVAKISEEPVELPEGSFGAVQPSREGSCCKLFRLENDKANGQKWFLGVPAIRSGIDSNEEQAFEKIFAILLS